MRRAGQLEELLDSPYPLAAAIAACALERRESRGGHLRADFPHLDPALDRVHIIRGAAGTTRNERWT
jgi:L-aspartate oxidase